MRDRLTKKINPNEMIFNHRIFRQLKSAESNLPVFFLYLIKRKNENRQLMQEHEHY